VAHSHRTLIALLGLILSVVAPPSIAASSGYHLIRQMPLGDVAGWDSLTIDPQSRRLYLSSTAGIIVINIDTFQRVGTVPRGPAPASVGRLQGVAIAPELGRGFMSLEVPASVDIFDLKTLSPLGTAAMEHGSDAIVFDPFSKRVFTSHGRYRGVRAVTAIDAASGRRLASIALPGSPGGAVADGIGHVYINLASRSDLGRIDSSTLKLTARWPLAPCQEPSGLAIDAEHRRLFAGCGNQLMVMMDADSGKVLASVATGEEADTTAFDPGTDYAFCSNGEGTFTVAHEESPDRLTLVENVRTYPRARALALDTQSHRVFLVAAQFGAAPKRSVDNPYGYPTAVAGTAQLLVYGR
jgi:DNA-binding beta-propeller fold protein YncE